MPPETELQPAAPPDVPETRSRKRSAEPEPQTYYDVPMLKPPVWKWEITGYFFLGGITASSYLIARLAERFGGREYRDLTRTATNVAVLAFLPCPPLLIKDLGDPKRFHYMLRVFKPVSPMNVGTWTLTGYSGALGAAALREWTRKPRGVGESGSGGVGRVLGEGVSVLSDAAGIPLALLLMSYTGVLLSTTSTPAWAGNGWLAPLFSASAFSSGAAAVSLASELSSGDVHQSASSVGVQVRPSHQFLEMLESASRLVEAAALGGYVKRAGKGADSLTKGEHSAQFWGGVVGAGLAAPALLRKVAPKTPRARKWANVAGSVLALAGGLALRSAILKAGHTSANDPEAGREAQG
jgi:formate-dependent nitrite reductase membrane component NrfD